MCRYVRSGGIDFQEVGEGNLCDTATFRTISAWKLVAMGATFLFKKWWKVMSLGEMFSVHCLLKGEQKAGFEPVATAKSGYHPDAKFIWPTRLTLDLKSRFLSFVFLACTVYSRLIPVTCTAITFSYSQDFISVLIAHYTAHSRLMPVTHISRWPAYSRLIPIILIRHLSWIHEYLTHCC